MATWDVKGKVALVTGAGSGISYELSKQLLESDCSVVMADLRLRPEAQDLLKKYQHPQAENGAPSAIFQQTDLCDWSQINALWEAALKTFGRVDLLVNGAGLYEPPFSDFWNPPGVSPLSQDPADAQVGIYKTFAVNTIAPIRLSQIAIEYWLRPENKGIEGNILWVASMAGYIHGLLTPFYYSSKAAVVSMCKSLGSLKRIAGIRNSAVCPGVVDTPIFHPPYSRERVQSDDLMLTVQELVDVAIKAIRDPQYGDGNIIEVFCGGTRESHEVCVRDVPMEAVYNMEGLVGLSAGTHIISKQEELEKRLKEKGMGFKSATSTLTSRRASNTIMVDVRELTIPQAHAGIKAGLFTAKELTSAFLERIKKLDKGGPNINSTLAMSTTVLAEAEALDRYFEQNGKLKGKLHGIPILVKDQLTISQADVKGLVSTYGSAVAKDNVANQDATIITKLKEAGALILGKTTMAEWATAWFSANGATNYTFTKNPYNLSHDVGASSGGSGAAVAANFAICAVGEDTGGSIRVPSSFCNLVGIRTTPGLVSRHGFCPLIKSQDAPGPMAKTVTDCALLLDCMAGFDPNDDYTVYAARSASLGLPKGGSYAANLDAEIIKSARIGVVRQLFGEDTDPHSNAVNTVMESSMGKLKEAGTTFIDIHIDNLENYLDFGQIYLQTSRHDINTFLATKPHLPQDIASILPEKSEKSFLQMICSVAHGPENPLNDPTYAERLLQRDEFRRKINVLITTKNLDALVFPDVQVPPPRISDAAEERFIVDGVEDFPTNTFLASIARLPAISVPAGLTKDGLPVGIELVGLEYQEQHLLELAYGVESLVQARTCPPEPVDA
ncbi:hypothetical protein BHE90_004112 [Fusarium euwallaceae]|uniref:Amidase domain-containing protein n=1 Tax=Fusarium euwallaceae TaxID=1147111 RepID=A0A430M0A1_9HYPO|nr:hypothetical protein BHE90_004112 [Fusarium euwallaceae]